MKKTTPLASILLLLFTAGSARAQDDPLADRVKQILERSVVVDLHTDTTQLILEEGFDLGRRHDYGQVDIPRLREGGITGVFFATNPNSQRLTPLQSIHRGLEEVDAIRREVARHPSDLLLALTAGDILTAKRQNKIAVLIGIEGGHVIHSSLAVLRSFFALGARYMTLTHFTHTPWADSSGQPPSSGGLTALGRSIVQEMNRLGMMIDISHVSDQTFYDALEASAAPVIASHSSCRVFSNHPRNMSDDMLRALAKNGGVVHINYYNPYLDDEHRQRDAEVRDLDARAQRISERHAGDPKRLGDERRKLNAERIARVGRVSLSRLLDHFEHAARIAGVDHVGLGSDFDGVADQLPERMEDVSKMPNLVRGLIERGFSDADIEKILGGNTLRVMRTVERIAQEQK